MDIRGKREKKKKPQQYLEHCQSACRPRRVNLFAGVNTASTLSHRWHDKKAVASIHLWRITNSLTTTGWSSVLVKQCLDQVSMYSYNNKHQETRVRQVRR